MKARPHHLVAGLILMMAAPMASACSVVLQWQLPFAPQTTDLSPRHVAEFVVWLNRINRGEWPVEGVLVEGMAPASATQAKALATARADKVRRMVLTFTDNVLPVAVHASVAASEPAHGGDDVAVVQLVPSASARSFGCPTPG